MVYDGIMFDLKPTIDSVKSAAIRILVMGGAALIGLTWLSIGIFGFLSNLTGPNLAGLILGALFLVPTGLILLVNGHRAKQEVGSRPQAFAGQTQSHDPLVDIIESLKGRSPLVIASLSVVTGLIATRFPQFLTVFSQALKLLIEEFSKASQAAKSSPFTGPIEPSEPHELTPNEASDDLKSRRKKKT
jgi:hypothetical protein